MTMQPTTVDIVWAVAFAFGSLILASIAVSEIRRARRSRHLPRDIVVVDIGLGIVGLVLAAFWMLGAVSIWMGGA